MNAVNRNVIYPRHPSDQFFTPRRMRSVARSVLGRIDLDPATSDRNPLGARWYYTARDNGLQLPWWQIPGCDLPPNEIRVFVNWPYGTKEHRAWCERAMLAAGHGCHVLALPPARPGAAWYRDATDRRNPAACQVLCEIDGRLVFEDADGKPELGKDGRPQCARWASAFLYWGPDVGHAALELSRVGIVRACSRGLR